MQIQSVREKPIISVIRPVFNGGAYLKLSVESVINQTLRNFEFLILDDCSTDDSWDYLQSLNDERIKLYKNEKNKGLFFNLNALIMKTNSQLIKLWAQDDIMYSNCLNGFVQLHSQFSSIGFSYSGRDIINEKGEIKRQDFIDETPQIISSELHARIAFYTGSIAGNIANVCINKKALDAVGLFNEEMKISADFDMWVRLARCHSIAFIPDRLIQLRDHQAQLSRKEALYINHVREDLEVYRYLLQYINPSIKKEGIVLMRNHKLVFYYTLMVKAFLKGSVREGYSFFKELSSFDNFIIVSICFLRAKLWKQKKPRFE